jgi:CRISPR-associated protein Cas1
MMSRPDFVEKQVLYLESTDAKRLSFRNSNLLLTDENGKIILQHSCHKIFIAYIRGEFTITSKLLKNAKKFSFPLVFLTYSLKPYFVFNTGTEGNFLLRKMQYSFAFDTEIAKQVIANKISNQLQLMQSVRYKTKIEKESILAVRELLKSVQSVRNSQELLGIEGTASKLFFQTYFKNMEFKGRKPRIKSDPYNLLLDIGYTYLFNFIEANLNLYGFDNYYGFYHKLFFQRKSLVCDIIEPFRCIIDKRLRIAYNLKQIQNNDFICHQNRFELKREASKKYTELFLRAILEHKEDIFLYVQSYYRAFIKNKPISQYPVFNIGNSK